jgi:hypothetical protein
LSVPTLAAELVRKYARAGVLFFLGIVAVLQGFLAYLCWTTTSQMHEIHHFA